jgi:hypothetical protein
MVTVPLAPHTARTIDLAIGERAEGPLFMARVGRRLARHAAGRIVRTTARSAGITKLVTRTRCDTRSSPPHSTPGSRCGTCKMPPRVPIRGPRCGTTGPPAARPARDLHRRHLPRRRRTVAREDLGTLPPDGHGYASGWAASASGRDDERLALHARHAVDAGIAIIVLPRVFPGGWLAPLYRLTSRWNTAGRARRRTGHRGGPLA